MKTKKYTKYSVVMSVYKNDRAEWFVQALESLLAQTITADEIVIVVDGPVTPELTNALNKYAKNKIVSITKLKENKGLGNALNVGIKKAKNELIGRMDSDDIAVSDRFELQLAEFNKHPNLDILGGQLAEFINSPEEIVAYRRVPTTQAEIEKFSRRRNPFNHPTVMFKKSAIEKLGYYDASAIRLEDYDLWLRAISSGAVCANLDNVLVNYRLTPDSIKRRKTFTSLSNHIKARSGFYAKKYISFSDFAYGVSTQTILYIVPTRIADNIFRKAVRSANS